MAFVTDKQTLDDLAIFGKPGSESVFSLFNRTRTQGGAAILEDMFQYPLSDAIAINNRALMVKQFAAAAIPFPFPTDLFGITEHYLENTDQRTKITHEQGTIGKKLAQFISADTEFKQLQKGVQAVREILIILWDFLQTVPLPANSPYVREKENLLSLLQELNIQQLVQHRKETWNHAQLAEHDNLFRFRQRGLIKQLLQAVYLLDVYIAVARVATEKKFCFPKACVANSYGCSIRMGYHPLLKQPVANSVEMTPEKNMIFLTGANMAGKSTIMKTLGICMFLAHMGFPVPAANMEFYVMDGLYTTINLPDNLGMGTSHFYTEVLRIKKVAAALSASKNIFVIFDELFRGTNVKDAYEATIAVISAFSQKRSSLFIVSTHIIEAGEVLKETCTNMQFLYMPTVMQNNIPVYPYTIRSGITSDRHGMIIIQKEGILDILSRNKKMTPA